MLIKEQIARNFEDMLNEVKEYDVERFVKEIKLDGGITGEQNEILLKRYIEKRLKGVPLGRIIERTILILANDGLIWYVVGRHFGYDEDLYSVAKFGMIKAVDNFSFDRDCSFASFATRVMINEVLMHKRTQSRQIETVLSIESLDAPIDSDKSGGGVRYDLLAAEDDLVEEIAEQEYLKYIESLFIYLTPIEQKVIIHTFGLFGHKPLNQLEISKKIGVSQSYISRLTESVPKKLKILITNKDSEEYQKLTRKTYELVTE